MNDIKYTIKRMGLAIFIAKPDGDGVTVVAETRRIDKINGKLAKDCTDDELISDWQNGGKNWLQH